MPRPLPDFLIAPLWVVVLLGLGAIGWVLFVWSTLRVLGVCP